MDKVYKYELITNLKEFGNCHSENDYVADELVKEIWVAKYKTQRILVKKVKGEKYIMNEVDILKRLDNPNIVKLLDFQQFSDEALLVFPYYPLGDLFQLLTLMRSFVGISVMADQRSIMTQLCHAVSYIHKMQIVHRDLKLENILVSCIDFKSQHIGVVIADFGLSRVIKNQGASTPCGTFSYAAPELLSERLYSQKVDIWSLGCALFTLLVAYPPFYQDQTGSIYEKIRKGSFKFLSPFWDSISEKVKDLISKLLQVDPLKRLKAEEIESHPWLSGSSSTDKNTKLRPLWSPIPSILKTPRDFKMQGNYFQNIGEESLTINSPISQYSDLFESSLSRQESFKLRLSDSSLLKKRNYGDDKSKFIKKM